MYGSSRFSNLRLVGTFQAMVMMGVMLIVAARWVQLSKEEFASACESWSPGFGRRFCLGRDPGLSNSVSVWRLLVLA